VNHLSDDELVLHYYGEDGSQIVAVERHLKACAQCTHAYEALARSLDAVTPPEFVEAPDDTWALRQTIRNRVREQSRAPYVASAFSRKWIFRGETGFIALVWLVPLLYPVSLQALFRSGRWAQEHMVFIPLVALALIWACAGPFLAVLVLNRMAVDRFERPSTRVLVVGAVMAAISPSLFFLVSRVSVSVSFDLGLWSWYCAIVLASLAALFRWPNTFRSSPRSLYVHRLSAVVLTVFVLAHIVNQALAFVSLPAYTAMRSVMRVASQQPVSYTIMVAAVAIQIASGGAMGLKKVRAGAVARNLQAVSGWCLAAFLLAHVFSGLIFSPPPAATSFNQFDLLATARSTAQLPFLLLGVAAFLFHVGVYARLAALAYLAEASVRRLSYAGVFVATTVVVTVGLSLCGIRLIR
jgi:succinate dehydrogenase/fumarate reductase cytochrome b subunit